MAKHPDDAESARFRLVHPAPLTLVACDADDAPEPEPEPNPERNALKAKALDALADVRGVAEDGALRGLAIAALTEEGGIMVFHAGATFADTISLNGAVGFLAYRVGQDLADPSE